MPVLVAISSLKWYLKVDGKSYGPYFLEDVISFIKSYPSCLARKENGFEWYPVNYHPELRHLLYCRIISALTLRCQTIRNSRELMELEKELQDLKNSLEIRKKLDRAKEILMDVYSLSEQESFRRIQQYSMTRQKSIKEVAEAIIEAAKNKR